MDSAPHLWEIVDAKKVTGRRFQQHLAMCLEALLTHLVLMWQMMPFQGHTLFINLSFSKLMAQNWWGIQTTSRFLVRVDSLPGFINLGSATAAQCMTCPKGLRCPLGSSLESLKTGQSSFGETFTPTILPGYFSTEESGVELYLNWILLIFDMFWGYWRRQVLIHGG